MVDRTPQEFLNLVTAHIQDHAAPYGVLAGVVLIASAIFYKYSIPLYLRLAEIAIYAAIMHVVVATFVRVVSWFRGATAMKMLREDTIESMNPNWTVPWYDVWNVHNYNPEWVKWVDLGFLIGVYAVVLYFRPPDFPVRKVKSTIDKEKLRQGRQAYAKGGTAVARPGAKGKGGKTAGRPGAAARPGQRPGPPKPGPGSGPVPPPITGGPAEHELPPPITGAPPERKAPPPLTGEPDLPPPITGAADDGAPGPSAADRRPGVRPSEAPPLAPTDDDDVDDWE